MRLSILLATNRKGLLPCSRIAQACSWASPEIEVIVRDNSGDPEKRKFLALCQREHCKIVIAEPCDILTNFSDTLRRATGEFVFVVADDDFCFDQAIATMPGLLRQHGKDASVAGVTGGYAVESTKGTAVFAYPDTDAEDVVTRIRGYLSQSGPNILLYSPLRREMVERVFVFMNAMPALFSFHDQILSLLYLMNGKLLRMNRLLYLYEVGPWENGHSAQKRDVDFYRDAGFDPAMNKLHWFICGFEGAVLARNATLFPDHPLPQRQSIADLWFSAMFARFQVQPRLTFDSPHTDAAERLSAKFKTSAGQISFQHMLTDMCELIALFSPNIAQRYHDFWDAVINRRAPAVAQFAGRAAHARVA